MANDATMSTEELAQLLGVSRQTVNELARRGVIPKSSRGRFDLAQVVPAYCRHLREQAAGRRGRDAEGSLDLVQERSKLARAQTLRTQMDIAERQKALIARSEVYEEGHKLAVLVLNHLQQIAPRVSDRIAAEFGPTATGFDVERCIQEEIDLATDDFRQANGYDRSQPPREAA